MMKRMTMTRGALLALLAMTGCDASGAFSSGGVSNAGDFGATPGGVKDLRFARSLVKEGRVPPPEALLVEAMFAEHDLPLHGAPCAELLCLRAATGTASTPDGKPAGWVQVGLSSTIDPATYQRA